MKESMVKTNGKILNMTKNYSFFAMFLRSVCFIFGVVISRGYIFGSYYPFGLSLCASVSGKMLFPTVLGSVFGYLMPLRFGTGIRYISTIISIIAVKWALSDVEKLKNHLFFTPTVVFLSSIVTGFASNCADGFNFYGFLITLTECIIASSVTYFFTVTFKVFEKGKINNLSLREFVCLSVSLSAVLLTFSEVLLHGVSVGRILAISFVLIAAHSFGVMGGSVTGISTGAILVLPSFGFNCVSCMYAFAGMISGAFASFGKFATCFSFSLVYVIVCAATGDLTGVVCRLYELIFGIVMFSILPKKVFKSLKSICIGKSVFISNKKSSQNEDISWQLRLISDSFSSFEGCLDKVQMEVLSPYKTNFEDACFDSVKSYCLSCGLKKHCWERNTKLTYDSMRSVIKRISEVNDYDNLNIDNLNGCRNFESVLKRLWSIKSDFSSYKLVKSQALEFKDVASRYFEDISYLLACIACKVKENVNFDDELSYNIKEMLIKNEIAPENITCKKISEKLFIEIKVGIFEKAKFNSKILNKISNLTGKKLDDPVFSVTESGCIVRISEKKRYKVNFSVTQHSCNGGKFCGDSCRCFENNFGKFSAVLSDGMGTGSTAALEGSLVAELAKQFLKFGIDFNCALKIINSIMVLNTKSEALATLDVVSIDLYSGEAMFIKAGSPTTFIVGGENIRKVNFSSLPVGILNSVSASSEVFKLSPQDKIIMLSDGVTDIGEEWLTDLLGEVKGENLAEISKFIVSRAVKSRSASKDDDITAMVLSISEV